MFRKSAKMIVIAIAASAALPAHSQQFENLDRLDSIVAMSVGANIGQPGGAISGVDRRLKLAACPQMPEVTGTMLGSAIVECKFHGWRIRVPLAPGGMGSVMAQTQRTAYGRSTAQDRQIIVKRGDPVQLIAGGGSFTVTRLMVADEDGAVGDMIRVRVDRKSDPVLARVEQTGIVRAPGI